jgi:hypothetical protein
VLQEIVGRAAFSTGLGGSVGRLRRVAAALVTVVAAVLATAGSAAAYTPNPVPLNSPWVAKACCGASAPAWYKDAFGIVHLQGAVTHGIVIVGHGSRGLPSLIGTLPAAARPTRDVYTIVHTFNGTYADLAIAPNGQISVIDPRPPAVTDLSFVSFEGITYQPAAKLPTSPIAVNGLDWSPNAGFGATTPSWYKDGSGIVHLEGAVKQISTAGSDPSLIGTLPAVAAPARTIYTIVHTFAGTYADLVITNQGAIFIEGAPPGPAPPAVTDLSFVSLEGVSYYPLALFSHISQLNTTNWAPACCGSGPEDPSEPGWVEDNAGIVHLQGGATQTSSGGPNANLIATLPSIISPTRTVYTIAETNSGTYADLAIEPNGQILVIAPRPPATEDLGFVSLEGITYQPTAAAGPHALSLTSGGGVLALLRKPRALALRVFTLGPGAHLVGTVKLGNAPAGPSRFHWDLRVRGHRLPAGTYIAELVALSTASPLSGGPGVTFRLTFSSSAIRVLSSTCSAAAATNGRC